MNNLNPQIFQKSSIYLQIISIFFLKFMYKSEKRNGTFEILVMTFRMSNAWYVSKN